MQHSSAFLYGVTKAPNMAFQKRNKLNKFYINRALLLRQNRVLVLLTDFFTCPYFYQNDDKIS